MLRVVARNLAENAVRYAGEGSTATLSVARDDGEVVLRIADDGSRRRRGRPATPVRALLPRRPLARVARDRPGPGDRQARRELGGRARRGSSHPGRGARDPVRVPCSRVSRSRAFHQIFTIRTPGSTDAPWETRGMTKSRISTLSIALLLAAAGRARGRVRRRRQRERRVDDRPPAAETSPAASRPTAPARSGRTRRPPPSASSARTPASRSPSASPAPAAASSGSAAARPTSRTPRVRSRRTRRCRCASRTTSSTSSSRSPTTRSRSSSIPENDWATCLTVEQLKKIWEPGSKVNNWNQVDSSFPDQELKLFGAGTDSGTFDYFTDVINGEEGASRSDYSATEDDNVTVQGVSGDKGAPRLLRLLVLRGEPGHAQGGRDRRRRRLRRAERRDSAGRHVQAARRDRSSST